MRLLVVEDDPRLSSLLARGLREEGYAVDIEADGRQAVTQAVVNSYDAMILDVSLPGLDGFGVLTAIRARGLRTPVLMLTARDTTSDRIAGLDAGADDYVGKPFDFGEVLARLRALLRRPEALQPDIIRVADLTLDMRSHAVSRGAIPIALSAKEFSLLSFLARHAHMVVSRADIVAHVWDDNHDPFTNAVEVYMNRLRGKIDKAPCIPLLHTRRGAGYMLSDAPPP